MKAILAIICLVGYIVVSEIAYQEEVVKVEMTASECNAAKQLDHSIRWYKQNLIASE